MEDCRMTEKAKFRVETFSGICAFERHLRHSRDRNMKIVPLDAAFEYEHYDILLVWVRFL